MSATFIDSVLPRGEAPREWPVHTADLDPEPTADVHEEHTADLQDQSASSPPAQRPPASRAAPRAQQHVVRKETAAAPAPVTIAPGAILCDRYILEQVIGRGGTAVVYRARDIRGSEHGAGKSQVAIKMPLPGSQDPARATTRLKHEFERAQHLSHPNIVQVFDLHCAQSPSGDTWFMTMELIEGKLLSALLKERTSVPVSLAHKILRASAQALSCAHQRQVIHGDFKPANVFVTPDAGVKIVDFGAAAASTGDTSRIHAATPAYASPEVLSGQTPECRDDVFSFACVAYELLTGQHPFDHKSSLQARDAGHVPQRAWNLSATQWLALLSALSWQREQRPADIEALMERLTSDFSDIVVPEMTSLDAPQLDSGVSELPPDIMPPNRSWGFIAFAAAVLGVIFIAAQRNDDPAPASRAPTSLPKFAPAAAVTPFDARPAPPPVTRDEAIASPTPAAAAPEVEEVESPSTPLEEAIAVRSKPAAPVRTSDISFENSSVVTSETSIAAVFVAKRSPPLKGRAVVHWEAIGGTAELESDFLIASGTVEFADGQATRAIYVPLRNDQVREEDEEFSVVLRSSEGAKLRSGVSATATVRDDD